MTTRIMVINDTQEILELFKDLLEEEGYETVLYSYAVRDLQHIERVKPDLIILDFIFGEEKVGWELLQKLRMYPPTATLPVVVCTAAKRTVDELEGHLKTLNVNVVLKPFNIDDLLLVIKRTLEGASSSTIEDERNQE
jgi:DNA-binding response OmpR family regulator